MAWIDMPGKEKHRIHTTTGEILRKIPKAEFASTTAIFQIPMRDGGLSFKLFDF